MLLEFFYKRAQYWGREYNKANIVLSSTNQIVGILYVIQPAITCSKLTIETVEQGVKYVQN